MLARVNSNCIGCGLCANLCPEVFTMLDEGVAAAKDEFSSEFDGQVQEAAESVPVEIDMEADEDDGEELSFEIGAIELEPSAED